MTQSPKIQNAKPKRKEKLSDKEQSERFKEAAHDFVDDDAKVKFESALIQVIASKAQDS